MKTNMLIISLVLLGYFCGAQTPNWISDAARRTMFPEQNYFVGFWLVKIEKGAKSAAALAEAEKNAKRLFMEDIGVTLKENFKHKVIAKGLEYYSSTIDEIISTTEFELPEGINCIPYFDEKASMAYYLVYVSKEEIARSSFKIIDVSLQKIAQQMAYADSLFGQKKTFEAVKTLIDLNKHFIKIDKCYDWLIKTSDTTNYATAEVNGLQSVAIEKIGKFNASPDMDISSFSKFLSYNLYPELLSDKEQPYSSETIFEPILLSDTLLSNSNPSEFSISIREMMISELYGKVNIVNTPSDSSLTAGCYFIIQGIYSVKNGQIIMNLELTNPASTQTYRRANRSINTANVVLDTKPVPLTVKTKQTDLKLDVSLNKAGIKHPVYMENEDLQIQYLVNKPCFVRAVHFFPDGQKALIIDKQIKQDEIGQVFYSDKFTIVPVCGEEKIFIRASEQPFEELDIEIIPAQNGLAFYKVNDDDVFVIKTMRSSATNAGEFDEKMLHFTSKEKKVNRVEE